MKELVTERGKQVRDAKAKHKRQSFLDPRQTLFLKNYTDPTSKTFGDCRNSALKAGYAKHYSDQIVDGMPDWLYNNIKYSGMLKKAERNLNDALELDVLEPVVTMIGILKDENGKTVFKRDSKFMFLKHDASKFVAERLGKRHWSLRKELTGPEGSPLMPQAEVEEAIKNLKGEKSG